MLNKIVFRKIRLYLASKIDSKLQKCPTFGGSLQNPAAFNQKGYYTKITQNDSVCLGFDAEVSKKILQGLYYGGPKSPSVYLSPESILSMSIDKPKLS